jgi:phospholipid-binding lipoprotein MlaA
VQSPAERPLPTASDAEPVPPEDGDADALFAEELSDDLEQQTAPDPWERFNRGVFAFNQGFDRFLTRPALRGYRYVVPKPGRRALYRAFRNLRSPAIFTNHLLQLRFGDAARTVGRFVLNSTVGAAGLLDAGERGAGWAHEPADFGQTLGRYGVPSGPYLVLPVLGPSLLRELVGMGTDFMLDPLTWVIGPVWWIPTGVGGGFTRIDAYHEDLEALEEESVEIYAALRNVYYQDRLAAIRRALEHSWCPLHPGGSTHERREGQHAAEERPRS